jgi:uncharacterized membrane protein YphA (DoxX/SURF4 family)
MRALRSVFEWAESHRAELLDVLRIYLGVGLVVRGALFVGNPATFDALVSSPDLAWLSNGVFVHIIGLVHIGAGVLLAAGLGTRFAAAVQVPVVLGALVFVHSLEGIGTTAQSFELAALVLLLLLVFAAHGSGPWSLDAVVARAAERDEAADADLARPAVIETQPPASAAATP